jgi:hypothetical protein
VSKKCLENHFGISAVCNWESKRKREESATLDPSYLSPTRIDDQEYTYRARPASSASHQNMITVVHKLTDEETKIAYVRTSSF